MPAKVLYWRGKRAQGLARLFAGRRVRRMSYDLMAACQAECPVDTGALRDSHRVVEGPQPHGFSVVAGMNYSYFVHDGTRYQKANPWMERAAKGFIGR